ncbi:putative uncharacterized transposon-derived protein F54H12.3, partial [Dictyocoela muelleri]
MCLYSDRIKKDQDMENEMDIIEKIIKIHENLSHRKTIIDEIKKNNIDLSAKKIKEILESCIICKMNDKKKIKVKGFNFTSFPGENIAVDILEFKKGVKILTAIDYFSRKIFAKFIRKKNAAEVITLLDEIFEELKFKLIISDNGKEFRNKNIAEWCN